MKFFQTSVCTHSWTRANSSKTGHGWTQHQLPQHLLFLGTDLKFTEKRWCLELMKEARTIYHSQPFIIHGGTSRNPSFSSVSSFFLITPNLVSRIQIIMNLNLYNLVSYPQSLIFIFIYIYKFVQELTVDWGTNLQ